MTLVLILIAGLMGASGVVLAAAAAHAKSGMGLDGAGYLLLFHAVAVLSGVALLQQGLLLRPLVLGVLSGWVLGSALFAGDIALRAFVGYPLFPMAAPTGGVVLILAWLALAVAAILALLPRYGHTLTPLPAYVSLALVLSYHVRHPFSPSRMPPQCPPLASPPPRARFRPRPCSSPPAAAWP